MRKALVFLYNSTMAGVGGWSTKVWVRPSAPDFKIISVEPIELAWIRVRECVSKGGRKWLIRSQLLGLNLEEAKANQGILEVMKGLT